MKAVLDELGPEDTGKKQWVYLATVSRVLPDAFESKDLVDIQSLSRETIRDMFLDAFNNPMEKARGGRPRTEDDSADVVDKLVVVFQERHAAGDVHFHIAIKLLRTLRFGAAKRTLRQPFLLHSLQVLERSGVRSQHD